MNYENAIKNIRSELKSYLVNGNLKSVVLGVSGGIDSTLCALLAKPVCDELKIPLIGRSLPTSSNSGGENSRAIEIGELFCTDFKEINIHSQFVDLAYMAYENKEGHGHPHGESRAIQNGNIKARIRMIYLYDLASVNRGMVLSTDNLTEYLLGFWTLHGDVGDYGMIQSIWKTEVYEMSQWIAENELITVDERIAVQKVIDADATDGLGISNTDLDQIMPGWEGSSREGYRRVDNSLINFTEWGSGNLDDPIIHRHLRTEFKRNNPYNIPKEKITNK
jgi:NAD+ synthetase